MRLRGRFWETKKVTHTTIVYMGTTSVESTKALESSGNLSQIQIQHLTYAKQVLYNWNIPRPVNERMLKDKAYLKNKNQNWLVNFM